MKYVMKTRNLNCLGRIAQNLKAFNTVPIGNSGIDRDVIDDESTMKWYFSVYQPNDCQRSLPTVLAILGEKQVKSKSKRFRPRN